MGEPKPRNVNSKPINQKEVIEDLEARASIIAEKEYLSLITTTECINGKEDVPKYVFHSNKLSTDISSEEKDRFQKLINKINELMCNTVKLQKELLNEEKTDFHPNIIEELNREAQEAQIKRINQMSNQVLEKRNIQRNLQRWTNKATRITAGPVAPSEENMEEEEPMKTEDIINSLETLPDELDEFQQDIKIHLGNILKHIVHDRSNNNVPDTSTVPTEKEDSYKAIEELLDFYNNLFKEQDGGSVVSQSGGFKFKWTTATSFLFKNLGRYSLESIATLSNPKNLFKIPKFFKGFFKWYRGLGLITVPLGFTLSLALMVLSFTGGVVGFLGIPAGLLAVGGAFDITKDTIQVLINALKGAFGGTSVTIPEGFGDLEEVSGRNYKRKSKKQRKKSKKQRKKSRKQIKKSKKQRKKSRKQRKSH